MLRSIKTIDDDELQFIMSSLIREYPEDYEGYKHIHKKLETCEISTIITDIEYTGWKGMKYEIHTEKVCVYSLWDNGKIFMNVMDMRNTDYVKEPFKYDKMFCHYTDYDRLIPKYSMSYTYGYRIC
jgi:hypothetical protein